MPNSFSASEKASSKFSLLLLRRTTSMSTRSGLMACTTDWNATPSRQLGPKSFTSIPKFLKKEKCENVHFADFAYTNLSDMIYIMMMISKVTYLAAVHCTHWSSAFLALPLNLLTTFLFIGGLPVPELVILSTEELLLDRA